MWKWKLLSFGRLGVLRRTIKEEGQAYSSHTLSQIKEEGHVRPSPFLFWFNEVPGCFTPGPNAISSWVAPRGVSQFSCNLGMISNSWRDEKNWRYRCREEYLVRWGLADLVHYGALLAVGFNLLHQWKPPVLGLNVIEQTSLLCPVKAIKEVSTVRAQPLESYSVRNVVPDKFKNLVVDEVPELDEKLTKENKLEDKDTVEKVEHSLREIENAISLEILNALGVERLKTGNKKQGMDLLRQAARKGNAKAFFHLGNAYEKGVGVAKNLCSAAKFYKIATSLGSDEASFNLAVFHLQGIGGVEVSEEKAVDLLTKAAENGLEEACLALGLPLVEKETKLEENISEIGCEDVQEVLNDGIEGFLDPIFNLAASMESGYTAVPQDFLYSLELYRMAADGGHQEARQAFLRLYSQLFGDPTEHFDAGGAEDKRELKHVASSPGLLYASDKLYSVLDRKTVSCEDFGRLVRRESQEDSGVDEDQRVVLVN